MKIKIKGGLNQAFFLKVMLCFSFSLLFLGNNLFDKKILFLNFLVLLIFNLKKMNILLSNIKNTIPFIIVLIWCLVSSFWSDWQLVSIESSLTQALLFITCFLICNTYSPKIIFKALRFAAVVTIFANLAYILIFPSSSFSAIGMTGLYSHKNNLGLIMSLSSILLFFDYLDNKKKVVLFLLVMALIILLMSLSKTSIALFMSSILVSFFFKNKFNKKTLNFYYFNISLILTFLSITSVIYSHEILDYLYYNFDEEFLTGRGMLWLTMLLHAENNLLLGFGYDSVWGKGELSEIYFTELYLTNPIWVENLAASDGGFIDILISLGIIGFFLFIYFIVTTFKNLLKYKDSLYFKPLFALFFFSFFHNITESTYLLATNALWFITILVSCMPTYLANKKGGLGV